MKHKKVDIATRISVILIMCCIFVWTVAGGLTFHARTNGYAVSFDLGEHLITIIMMLVAILSLSIISKHSPIWKYVSIFLLFVCFLFGCITIGAQVHFILVPPNDNSSHGSEIAADEEAPQIHGYCVPADAWTAAFTDMNATLYAEVPFQAVRVTAQSTVNGHTDDLIELQQTGSDTWSVKVRFEIAGTHQIELIAYPQSGDPIYGEIAVDYPFS